MLIDIYINLIKNTPMLISQPSAKGFVFCTVYFSLWNVSLFHTEPHWAMHNFLQSLRIFLGFALKAHRTTRFVLVSLRIFLGFRLKAHRIIRFVLVSLLVFLRFRPQPNWTMFNLMVLMVVVCRWLLVSLSIFSWWRLTNQQSIIYSRASLVLQLLSKNH